MRVSHNSEFKNNNNNNNNWESKMSFFFFFLFISHSLAFLATKQWFFVWRDKTLEILPEIRTGGAKQFAMRERSSERKWKFLGRERKRLKQNALKLKPRNEEESVIYSVLVHKLVFHKYPYAFKEKKKQ